MAVGTTARKFREGFWGRGRGLEEELPRWGPSADPCGGMKHNKEKEQTSEHFPRESKRMEEVGIFVQHARESAKHFGFCNCNAFTSRHL